MQRFAIFAWVVTAFLTAQREVPPPPSFTGDHVGYKPHQYRGANFWPTRSLGPTNLWNRWPSNRDAVECHFAHCARAGVNVMRIYLDYRAFLWARLFGNPSNSDAYAENVKEVMDLANRYGIGLIPVFFNPFGDLGGGLFSGVCVKLIRTFQEAWWFVGVDDPGVHSQFFANASVETGGTPPFFVTNHESASNGTDGMVAAWLQFVGPASIKLTASGVKGTSAFTNAATIAELETCFDFVAKVVGVTSVGIVIPCCSDRFRVVWLQYGVLLRADLLLST
jgi:hypothetical protein